MGNLENILQKIIHKPEKWIVGFLFSLFLISIIGISVLEFSSLLGERSFGREVGKTLLQIMSVSVVGTTATLLLSFYNNRRSELQKETERIQQKGEKEIELQRIAAENKNQYIKNILKQVNQVYADIKRSRRMLRAKAFKSPYYKTWDDSANVILTVYDEYMECINNSQLTLEMIAKEIGTNRDSFFESNKILEHIKPMEETLKTVVTEYEEKRSMFKGDPALLPIGELHKLKLLLASQANEFTSNFFLNNSVLITILNNQILHFK